MTLYVFTRSCKMHIFISSLVLTIALVINNSHCTPEDVQNKTNEISSIYFNIEELQQFLNNDNPCCESLVKIVKEMSSTLISVLSKLESLKQFESEVEALRKDVNETRCSLSTRIIDIENNISKLKNQPEAEIEYRTDLSFEGKERNVSWPMNETEDEDGIGYRTTLSFPRRGNIRKILMDSDFFVTPKLQYLQAKMNCFREGGTPFIPRTKDEYHYLVEQVTKDGESGWMPLNDISHEGNVEWDDGTSYAGDSIYLQFSDGYSVQNEGYHDCVAVSERVIAYWVSCSDTLKMLCLKTESA